MTIQLTEMQHKTVTHRGHVAVLGGAGTGKTTAMLERIASVVESGKVKPEDIYIVGFTYYAWNRLKDLLTQRLGAEVAHSMNIGTIRRFAQVEIERSGEAPLDIASSRVMRRSMRQAMRDSGFEGNIMEAEHVIRSFKSRARKPSDDEPHYSLFASYKRYVELDRHDIPRQHIIGMRQMSYKPLNIKHIFIDDIQDINRIQLLWVNEHIKHGAVLSAYGNDDTCVFTRDGALGIDLFTDIKDIEGIKTFKLKENFRLDDAYRKRTDKAFYNVKERLPKDMSCIDTSSELALKNHLEVSQFTSVGEEINVMVERLQAVPAGHRIGIITRTDWQAVRIHRALENAGISHSSFAHNIWDVSGSIMVMDLLHVMLNKAENKHLRNVLLGFGLPSPLVDQLFSAGLKAQNWLPNGAQLPKDVDLPADILQNYGMLSRQLVAYFQVMVKKAERPKTVFKAAAATLIERMDEDDKANALLAIETLLAVQGPLIETLERIIGSQSPNWNDRIIVGPARTMRQQEFDWVFMPHAGEDSYPFSGHKILGVNDQHERRLMYMALSRAKQHTVISHTLPLHRFLKGVVS